MREERIRKDIVGRKAYKMSTDEEIQKIVTDRTAQKATGEEAMQKFASEEKELEDFENFDLPAKDLAILLDRKEPHYPLSDAYEEAYLPGKNWWSSQQEHIVRWLNELDGPGAYGRTGRGFASKHFWNHFQCAPGMLWVAEALEINSELVVRAADEAHSAKRGASQCAIIRRIIPWKVIARAIAEEWAEENISHQKA